MAERALPQNVGRLLDKHIYSVSQLEILLFLRKFQQRNWTAHQIANELHTNDAAALAMLCRLSDDGLIKRSTAGTTDQFSYDASAHGLEPDMFDLARVYKESRMRVVDRIYQKPSSETSFDYIADAFILRKDEP